MSDDVPPVAAPADSVDMTRAGSVHPGTSDRADLRANARRLDEPRQPEAIATRRPLDGDAVRAARIGGRFNIAAALIGAVGVVGGAALGISIAAQGNPKPVRVPTVSITSPTGTVSCQPKRPQCRFGVAGRSTGVTTKMDIFVLVFPQKPGGVGWFIQQFAAAVAANGHWTETPAYLGSHTAPVCSGDTLQIEAVVVRSNASYQGTPLGTRARQVLPIQDPRAITGFIAQSPIVFLTAERQVGSSCSRAP